MGTKNLNSATDLITFTRASGGTALRKVGYGTELVTNGDFSTSDLSDWSESSSNVSLAVVSGQLNVVNSGSGYGYASYSVTSGLTYIMKVDWIQKEGQGRMFVGNTFGSNNYFQLMSAGTHTQTFTATSDTLHIKMFDGYGGSATNIFDNISIKEINLDRATDPLVLYNHPNNTPRIEYNADGTVKGLLIEEARTNSVTYSNDFSDSSWDKINVSLTASSTTSPDGSSNGWKLTATGANYYFRITKTLSTVTTYSIYVKKDNADYVALGAGGGAKGFVINFSFATETIVDTNQWGGSVYESSIVENAGNGWYRIIVTGNQNGAGRNIAVFPWDSATAPTVTENHGATSTNSVYIYGAQTEESKSTPSSYIPTTGSTATRAADVASIPTANFGYNDDAGTVVVNGVSSHKDGDSGVFYLYENNSNFMGAKFSNHNRPNSIQTRVVGSGGDNAQLYPTPALANTSVNYAVGFATNNVSAVIDGGTIESDTDVDLFAVSQMSIGYRGPYNDLRLNGHIKSIKYYPRRLTDTQLQELTT